MFDLRRTPLDVARELFRVTADFGHLITHKEAAEIGSLFCDIYNDRRPMPRKGSERHFDTLILERRSDFCHLRVKGALDALVVFSCESWLSGQLSIDADPISWDAVAEQEQEASAYGAA